MPTSERPLSTWPDYIKAVREEVREGSGIFRLDDDLRSLFQECFDRGDEITGIVLWNVGSQASDSNCDPSHVNAPRNCSFKRVCKRQVAS
jgi:hypothetical protein